MTRVAILGFDLESNAFAPVSEERHFRSRCYLEGVDERFGRTPAIIPAAVAPGKPPRC